MAGGDHRAEWGQSARGLSDGAGLHGNAGLHGGDDLAGGDLLPRRDAEPGDGAAGGRGDGVLHLHGLQDDQRLVGCHLISFGGQHPDYRPRGRRDQ